MASNVEVLRTAIDAFNRRDFDAALEHAHDDATWAPFIARTETPLLRGREEIRRAWERQFDVMDLRIEELQVVADDGDRVVTQTRMTGRGHGSDVAVDGNFAQIYTFEDGRLRSVESFASVEEALVAAGLG